MTNSSTILEEGDAPDVASTSEIVRQLARVVETNGLSELFFEDGDRRIVLRTAAFTAPVLPIPQANTGISAVMPHVSPTTEVLEEPAEAVIEEGPDESRIRRVEAPIMGVFYRASSQGAPPLIEVGDILSEGQIIGLIEAMKVFSEVPAPAGGRVIDIPAKNGALVQPGDVLVLLELE